MQAVRTAAAVVDGLGEDQLDLKIRTNTLKDLKGVGPKTAAVVVQAHKGQVPDYLTTLAGHRFWEEDDPKVSFEKIAHFVKNLGLIGGLLLATVDTEGKPSVGYRARRAAKKAANTTEKSFEKAQKRAAKAQKKTAKRAKKVKS